MNYPNYYSNNGYNQNNYNSNNPNVIPMVPNKMNNNPYVINNNNNNPYNNFNQQPPPQFGQPGFGNYYPPQNNPWASPIQQQQQQPPINNFGGTVPMNINNNNKNNQQIVNNNQQQRPQNVPNNAAPVNSEYQKQLEQLRSRYPFNFQPNNSNNILLDLDIPSMKIPIRIQLDKDFPRVKPSVFLRKHFVQQNVDDKTWRVRYESIFRWDNNSNLLNLVQAINQAFQQYPPQPDYLKIQISEIKSSVNEQSERSKIKDLDAQKVFPGRSQTDYRELLQQQSWAEPIQSSNDIQILRKRVGEIADFNLKLSSDLLEQQTQLENKKQALTNLSIQYEEEKNNMRSVIQASNSIQERFSSMSIIQALGQQIDEIEQAASQIKSNNFDDDIRKFRDLRKNFHLLNKKREKLMNN